MNAPTNERQQLIEVINTLPDEALIELASFVDYLCYKSTKRTEAGNGSSAFLLSIAGGSDNTPKSGHSLESPLEVHVSCRLCTLPALLERKVLGLGTSAETNIWERDEEILRSEVDPIRGWSLMA